MQAISTHPISPFKVLTEQPVRPEQRRAAHAAPSPEFAPNSPSNSQAWITRHTDHFYPVRLVGLTAMPPPSRRQIGWRLGSSLLWSPRPPNILASSAKVTNLHSNICSCHIMYSHIQTAREGLNLDDEEQMA
ncbi:MAG: hypothetical protein FRX49_02235 [Trebouxia sp. A1-2]|nr:MAG: hypothetical protein FRX49_02235 [Trebouxia sp. A1-2]